MNRRNFILRSGMAIGATSLLTHCTTKGTSAQSLDSWEGVRAQFPLSPGKIHMSQMLLASHPRPVADEIERQRKNFDSDPVSYWESNFQTIDLVIQKSAAAYMQTDPTEVALTDSTTMGLATLYNGLRLKPGDEILSSTHDHYATEKAIEFAAEKKGALVRRVKLYDNPATVSVDEVVGNLEKAIQPATRVVALTWVHSSTGVKLPIGALGAVVRKANEGRDASKRILFCVDGVHGFGIEDVAIPDLACDFFVAGTHKWIFGPRGTGVMFGRKDAWDFVDATIPTFDMAGYGMWLGMFPERKMNFNEKMTPGGFHSFEYRWSLPSAFDFQMQIGKTRVAERTHRLSNLLKTGLQSINHVKLYTPVDEGLSAGINCFDVAGIPPEEVVQRLFDEHKIIASTAPYRNTCVRLTPSLVNTEEEVALCISALENLKA